MDARLHPDVAKLLAREGWTELTAAQVAALGPISDGKHTLLVAPTGHGKTEAALLPIISRLLMEKERGSWPTGFKVIYVTPLRALNRDLLGRVTNWCKELELEIGVRHGDTTQSERARQARKPPDILITTPETLQLLLYGDKLRSHLATVRFVVLDEIHDLYASERGAQLMVGLERVEEVIGQPELLRLSKAGVRPSPTEASARPGGGFLRVGLSATVDEPKPLATWMGGRGRDVVIAKAEAQKEWKLEVTYPEPIELDNELGAKLSLPPAAMAQLRIVREIVRDHARVLVFQNTRDSAELMVSRGALLDDGEQLLELHHGSLSFEHRAEVEDKFKAGAIRAMVATSSLELGIDIGEIDHVVQIHSPRSVARLVQRLGRAGHRVGEISHGTLIAGDPEDILECIAVAERAATGLLEAQGNRDGPLVVLANQIVALSNEYGGLDREWTRQVVTRAGPFAELDETLFDATWDALLDLRTLFEHEENPGRIGRSGRGRRHFLDHISLIPDETTYRIVDEAMKKSIGTVDDAFVAAALKPGNLFVMAGRNWRVLEVDSETRKVRVATATDLGSIPQWTGAQLPVSRELAGQVVALRRRLLAGEKPPVKVDESAIRAALAPLEKQLELGLEVPTDRVVTLEVHHRNLTINVALGSRGNEALGRIMQALLHQRLGAPVGMENDAYRIHLHFPGGADAKLVPEIWESLDPDGIDMLLAMVLRGSPTLRHHLVHVAKHFGALPKNLDPNRFSRAKLDALMSIAAMEEEAISRLMWDRLDVDAVADFLRRLPELEIVIQGVGPISTLGQDAAKRVVAPPRADDTLLKAVRERIENSDVVMTCVNCQSSIPAIVRNVARSPRCRRCGSTQVACLRPWHDEAKSLLKAQPDKLSKEQKQERERLIRNGVLVSSFGSAACRVLVARGVGADTGARILQKVADYEDSAFWRLLLEAELTFARTSAYWRR